MGIIALFLIVLIAGLFVINKATMKGIRTSRESILDDANAINFETYLAARKPQLTLIRAGVFILAFDIIMLIVVVVVFDLNSTSTAWENWFAALVMLILPALAIFLIIRGFLKLNQLKKQYNETNY